jgi:hypothetical protein
MKYAPYHNTYLIKVVDRNQIHISRHITGYFAHWDAIKEI